MRLKNGTLAAVVALALALVFFMRHLRRRLGSDLSSGTEVARVTEPPPHEPSLTLPSAAFATAAPSPTSSSPVLTDRGAANSSEGSRARSTLVPGFEKLPVDPLKERFIRDSRVSNRAKELFLSGIALSENLRKLRPEELGELGPRLQSALRKDQDAFLLGIRTLTENPLPEGLREDLVGMSVYLRSEDSPEMRMLATRQIEETIASGNLSSGDGKKKMIDGILATVKMSADPDSGWAEVEKVTDANNPAQAEAIRLAHKLAGIEEAQTPHPAPSSPRPQ